ncbi:aminopeptidase, partial [Pseudomonas protegens]|uniref:aminopeptidase n=1 Tax=Pseudomonas protegens TaxID=380021 RepID=UPI00223BFFD3
FVEQEAPRQWRAYRGLPPQDNADVRQRDQFIQLLLDARKRLEQLYAQPLSAEQMRQRKAQEFEVLRRDYRQLRDREWAGSKRYDAWINAPLNNARLLPFGLYDQWVPAFAALFKEVNGDWPAFFLAVEKLGRLPAEQRKADLLRLQSALSAKPAPTPDL